MALTIEYWSVERLKPYLRNPRNNDSAVDRMVASIKQFGFAVPILARVSGEIVDGHLRMKAALKIPMAEVPVIPCDGWTEVQVRAFRLMVNRSVTWAEWDTPALAVEFGELKALNFDLSMTGFSLPEIERYLPNIGEGEDDAPEPPVEPVTKLGDLWVMGEHRLLCGDATKAMDVQSLMGGDAAGLMNTDPPYGVRYDSAELHPSSRVSYAPIEGDQQQGAELQAFLEKAFTQALQAVSSNAAWYCWHAALTEGVFAGAAAGAAGVILHRQIIWVKPHLVFGRGQYHWKHEVCFMGWVKGNPPPDYSNHTDTTVWEVQGVQIGARREFGHSTPKPVELFRRPILKHLQTGEIAYDPFAGSGPQFIAAELTERRCFGLEIDPRYCDVIVNRWEKLTGKRAVLETAAVVA